MGTVVREDQPGGGITVMVSADPGDMTIAGTRVTVVTSPPDGNFKLAGLCPGVYRVAAVADGYRTHDFEEVTVKADAEASFQARLVARSQRMSAAELLKTR